MRLLLINANTFAEITERVAAEARRVAAPGTEIRAVSAPFGSSLIRTRADNAIAGHAALTAFAEHHEGCDAAVLAVSTETGLPAIRECSPIPVVGMTEASLFTACMLGGRFGLLVFDRRAAPLFDELVRFHGLRDRMAGLHAVEMTVDDFRRPDRVADATRRGVDLLVGSGAESVVVTGATMAGVARALQKDAPVPLVDGVSSAVLQAESLVRLALPKPSSGSYASHSSEGLQGVAPSLTEMLARRD